jgi:hypothetical protein
MGMATFRDRVHSTGMVVVQDLAIPSKKPRSRMVYGYREVKYFSIKIHRHCRLHNLRLPT